MAKHHTANPKEAQLRDDLRRLKKGFELACDQLVADRLAGRIEPQAACDLLYEDVNGFINDLEALRDAAIARVEI